MKVKLSLPREYDLKWPLKEDFPEQDRITFKMRRLTHEETCALDDSLFQSVGPAAGESLRMVYQIGTVRDKKIRAAVYGWENVLDEDDKPITFTTNKLFALIDCNAGLSVETEVNLLADLVANIDEVNNLAPAEAKK